MVYSGEMKFILAILLLQTASARLSCIGYGVANNKWCDDNCNMPTPNCPPGLCECVNCSQFDSQHCDGHKQCEWQGDSCGPVPDNKRALDTINCSEYTGGPQQCDRFPNCTWIHNECIYVQPSRSLGVDCASFTSHDTCFPHEVDGCIWVYTSEKTGYCRNERASQSVKAAGKLPLRSLETSDCSAHKDAASCDGDKACFWQFHGTGSYCDTKSNPPVLQRILADKCVGLNQSTCLSNSACFWDYNGKYCEAKGESTPTQQRSLVASDCSAHKDAASCDGDKACFWHYNGQWNSYCDTKMAAPQRVLADKCAPLTETSCQSDSACYWDYNRHFCITKRVSIPARSLDEDAITVSYQDIARSLDEPDCSQYNKFGPQGAVDCGRQPHCKWVFNGQPGGAGYCTWTKDAERSLNSDYSCWGQPSQDCIALFCNWDGQKCTPKNSTTKPEAVVFQI